MENEQNQNLNTPNLGLQSEALQNQKTNILKSKLFIGFVVISSLIAFLIGGFVLGNKNLGKKACTMEAKICPDGSSVGRTGPNCEFTKCPVSTADESTVNWKTYTNTPIGIQFKYPPGSSPIFPDQNAEEAPLIDLPISNVDDYSSFSIFVSNGQIGLPKSSTKDEVYTYNKGNTKMIKHPTQDYLVSDVKGQKQIVDTEDYYTGNTTFEYVYLVHNNKMYELRMRYHTENKAELSKLFSQILSTFTFTDSSTDTSNWKTYTNPISTTTLLYPPTWTIKESHELSNRTVDDPKEINTAIISGKEGQVKVQWGPMGFGGGCDQQYQKTVAIKNGIKNICLSDDKGNRYWSFISNEASNDKITEANATAYPPLATNSKFIETILSTLEFIN